MTSPAAPLDPVAITAAYDAFADVYDRFWGDVMTEGVLALVDRHLTPPPFLPGKQRVATPLTLLDLCCGSGQLASALLARGHDVWCVDASPRLLAHARRRAPEAHHLLQDARALELPIPVDAAVCAFDSLNHLPDLAALQQVFTRVFAALRPGGAFLFDLNTATGFRERFADDFAITTDDLVLTVEGAYDPPIGRYHITWLTPHPRTPAAWQRHEITLHQRCFATPDVLAALTAAGFTSPITLDAATEADMPTHTGRLFFLAHRP